MSDATTQHTPADVRERVAKIVREAMEDARRSERLNTFLQSSMWDYADRILALLRTPRGEGEAATTHLIRTAVAVADAAPWRQSPDMDLLKVAVRDHRAASGDPEPTMSRGSKNGDIALAEGDVVVVNLRPGDRLVVTLPRPVPAEWLEYMRAALQRWAPDVPALILTEGARLAVVRGDASDNATDDEAGGDAPAVSEEVRERMGD